MRISEILKLRTVSLKPLPQFGDALKLIVKCFAKFCGFSPLFFFPHRFFLGRPWLVNRWRRLNRYSELSFKRLPKLLCRGVEQHSDHLGNCGILRSRVE